MKWIVLGVCLLSMMPLVAFLRRSPRQRANLWTLLGFLPFVIQYFHLYMAVDSTAEWGGYVKGAEVSILDLIAIALYFSSSGTKRSVPFRYSMAFYFSMAVVSVLQAWQPHEALFFPWQLARVFLVYATVTKGCLDPLVSPAILRGMGAGIIFEAGIAVWQRYALGLTQTAGTEGHQNLLGVMSHLVILPFFALLLAGRRSLFEVAVVLAGAIVVVSTASRGTIGLEAFGIAILFLLSAARKWTPWKLRILVMAAVAMAAFIPAVYSSFDERFAKAPLHEDVYDDRTAYIKAAGLMLADHPLGIGANHFAVIGNVGGYYARGGVQIYQSALAGNVHNMYYLTAAETGYPGLIALLLLLACVLVVAFRCGWRYSGRDHRGDLVLGLGVAILCVCLHSWVEWSLATFQAEYLLAIAIGLVAGNAQQLGYWSARRFNTVLHPGRLSPIIPTASSTNGEIGSSSRKR